MPMFNLGQDARSQQPQVQSTGNPLPRINVDHWQPPAFFNKATGSAHQLDQLNSGFLTVTVDHMRQYFRSRKTLYKILTMEGQLYLPKYNECPLMFLQQLLIGKKLCFTNSQVKMVKVPVFAELTAKQVYVMVGSCHEIMMFLPDPKKDPRINREYLFNIINTVDEMFFMTNIVNAFKLRKEHELDKKAGKFEISSFMYNIIKQSNAISTRDKGSALNMLRGIRYKRKRPSASTQQEQELLDQQLEQEDAEADAFPEQRAERRPPKSFPLAQSDFRPSTLFVRKKKTLKANMFQHGSSPIP
jgi:hypothetical protein